MSFNTFTEYNIPQNAYTAFDALSMQKMMIDKLKATTNLTDQEFEGSNTQGIIDIIAQAYHVLIFYHNQTSSEALFSQAQIWENMNRILSLLDFKPAGYRTSFAGATITSTASTGVSIPRYSYITAGNSQWSLSENVYIGAGTTQDVILYEGRWKEYPTYIANGTTNEILTLALYNVIESNSVIIDHNNIHVYARKENGKWGRWAEVDTLFESSANDRHFEKRLNDRGSYEIKFGDGINGASLDSGDEVLVVYQESTGKTIKAGEISNSRFNVYVTSNISTIFNDEGYVLPTPTNLSFVTVNNKINSTNVQAPQDVDDMRAVSPKLLSAQKRVVTKPDYDAVISHNFNNIFKSWQIVNNDEFVSGILQYYKDAEMADGSLTSAINSIASYSNSCGFNNIYIFAASGIINALGEPINVPESMKQLVVDKFNDLKSPSINVVIMDTAKIAVLPIVRRAGSFDISDAESTKIVIKRDVSISINNHEIVDSVSNILTSHLKAPNAGVGSIIDVQSMTDAILNINGVDSIYTTYTSLNGHKTTENGLSFGLWDNTNPNHLIDVITKNYKTEYFMLPYLYDSTNITNYIEIE